MLMYYKKSMLKYYYIVNWYFLEILKKENTSSKFKELVKYGQPCRLKISVRLNRIQYRLKDKHATNSVEIKVVFTAH